MGLKSWARNRAVSLILWHIKASLEGGEYGEGALKMWNKILKFMDGKKTITGAILLALPKVAAAVGGAYVAAGGSEEIAAQIVGYGGGTVLVVVGVIHKVVKWLDDQTPNAGDNE